MTDYATYIDKAWADLVQRIEMPRLIPVGAVSSRAIGLYADSLIRRMERERGWWRRAYLPGQARPRRARVVRRG